MYSMDLEKNIFSAMEDNDKSVRVYFKHVISSVDNGKFVPMKTKYIMS